MHKADGERSQPLIECDPPEPAAVETRQRRLLLGVPMRIGAVTMQVPVQIVAMGMQMIMEMVVERISARGVRMESVGRDSRSSRGPSRSR